MDIWNIDKSLELIPTNYGSHHKISLEPGIIEKEMPLNISNLAYYDPVLKKGVKIGFKFSNKGKKIRFNKQTQKEI